MKTRALLGWFGGDKKLEQQKAALRECTESLAFLEKRVAHLAHLEATFADVWPRSSGVPAELRAKAGKIRELTDCSRTEPHPPSASSPISTTSLT